MKYLFLDTNIYLDMVVYRNKENPPKSCDYLLKLLEFDQVKLVIPKIVITEVERHLEDEINKVGEKLKSLKKSIEDIYWISNTEDVQNFDAKVKMLSKTVNQVLDEFERNNLKYKTEFKEKLEKIFSNKNNIVIIVPHFKFVGTEQLNYDTKILENADKIYFNTAYNSHAMFYKTMNAVRKNKIEIVFINSNSVTAGHRIFKQNSSKSIGEHLVS